MGDKKSPTADLSVVTAGSRVRRRAGEVEQAVGRAQDTGKGKPRRGGTARQRGVTAEQARRSERVGTSGERAYGAPLSTPKPTKPKKSRFRRKNDG